MQPAKSIESILNDSTAGLFCFLPFFFVIIYFPDRIFFI
jgi:hypothetical protein